MSTITKRFRVGQRVALTSDALANYGEKYRGKSFRVSSVATAYMPAAEFYAKGRPNGFHPGYDDATNCALYDCDGLNFSLYDWEVVPT